MTLSVPLDVSMTFESFVVGPGNRLAWEAARTTAESPGAAYNPLFIYSDTGLGKTHLLVAIANRAEQLQEGIEVVYTPLEQLLREVGSDGNKRAPYLDADILLIDDLQFVGHRSESHQTLFHILDHLLMAGRQVVLACDRPPLEMDGLDDRLLSRFSGGLVVDISRPNLATRRAILELRLGALGASLSPDVIDAIAQSAIENVRQLKGALNRVLAAQKAEGRQIHADEVDRLLASVVTDPNLPWLSDGLGERGVGEFAEFLTDVSSAVEDALTSPKWQEDLARAILKWEAEGYLTGRLENLLDEDAQVDSEKIIADYERDVGVLKGLAEEIGRLDPDGSERLPLNDPDRLDELRSVLEDLRRRKLAVDDFFFDSEKVVWVWPTLEERLIETWDDGDQG